MFVPVGRVLVPSSGELAPTIWFINGVLFVVITKVTFWAPVGLGTMPLSATVIAVGTSPSCAWETQAITSAKSCTTLFVCSVTALTFTSRPTTVIE